MRENWQGRGSTLINVNHQPWPAPRICRISRSWATTSHVTIQYFISNISNSLTTWEQVQLNLWKLIRPFQVPVALHLRPSHPPSSRPRYDRANSQHNVKVKLISTHPNPSQPLVPFLSQVHQNVIRLISIISAPPLSTAVTTPVNLPAPPPPLYSCLCSVSSSLKENEWISLIIVLLKLSLSYTFLLIL